MTSSRYLSRYGALGALGQAVWQLVSIAVLMGITLLLAEANLRLPSRVFFIVAAFLYAAYAKRQSPWLYLTSTLWFWTLTPLMRRLMDYHAGFDPQNIVLAVPNLLALLMLKDVLTSRKSVRQPEFAIGMLLLVPMLYGLCVNLVTGAMMSGLTAAADWFPPLLYYFYFLTLAPRIAEAEDPIRMFLTLNMAVVVGYGLVQYFNPLPWDVQWVLDSKLGTVGVAVPYGLRVFSTLNAPAVCAIWTGTLLLLSMHFRTRVGLLLMPLAALLLCVTFIRSMLGCVAIAIVVTTLLGGLRMVKPLALMGLAAAVMVVILGFLNPEVSQRIVTRFTTVQDLGTDESAIERVWLYQAAPGLIDQHPLGLGLGAVGRGAEVGGGIANLDSGPIAIFLTMGWIGGAVYVAGLLLTLAQSMLAARRTQLPGMLALTAVVVSGMVQIIFTNMVGLYAMTVWVSAGYIAAVQIHLRAYAKLHPRSRRSVVDWSLPVGDGTAAAALVGPSAEPVIPGETVNG
jgi:hypothetical protein